MMIIHFLLCTFQNTQRHLTQKNKTTTDKNTDLIFNQKPVSSSKYPSTDELAESWVTEQRALVFPWP